MQKETKVSTSTLMYEVKKSIFEVCASFLCIKIHFIYVEKVF